MENTYLDYRAIKGDIDKCGLSQREIADLTGIPKSSIQRYLSGNSANVPIDKIVDIAKAVGADPKHWLGWDDKESATDEGSGRVKILLDLFLQLKPEHQDMIIAQIKGLLQN